MNRSFSKIRHIQEVNILLEQNYFNNKIKPWQQPSVSSQLLKPKNRDSITKFQKWVINNKKDNKILGKYGADGTWGPNSQNAWDKYGSEYLSLGNKTKTKTNLGFPYDKLNNNPSSQFIAYIIKTSKGGLLGNDKEAYAEAAFNAIKSKKQYDNVKKYLGTDPYRFIADFMNTGKKYHVKRVYEHYLELFPTKNTNVVKNKPDNVTDFQNWVISVKKDKAILGKYGADGDWGPSTKNAWTKYGAEYSKTSNKSPQTKDRCIAISKEECDKISPTRETEISYDASETRCSAYMVKCLSEYDFWLSKANAWDVLEKNSGIGNLKYNAYTDGSVNWNGIYSDILTKKINPKTCENFINTDEADKKYGLKIADIVTKSMPSKSKINLSSLELGDIVGIYLNTSTNKGMAFCQKALDKDLDDQSNIVKEPFTFNTHVGFVGAIKNGVPIIIHNIHGHHYATPATKLLSKTGNGMITWVINDNKVRETLANEKKNNSWLPNFLS